MAAEIILNATYKIRNLSGLWRVIKINHAKSFQLKSLRVDSMFHNVPLTVTTDSPLYQDMELYEEDEEYMPPPPPFKIGDRVGTLPPTFLGEGKVVEIVSSEIVRVGFDSRPLRAYAYYIKDLKLVKKQPSGHELTNIFK